MPPALTPQSRNGHSEGLQTSSESGAARQRAAEKSGGVRRSAAECGGVRRSAAECGGERRSAAESGGVRRRAAECGGVRRRAAECGGGRLSAAEPNRHRHTGKAERGCRAAVRGKARKGPKGRKTRHARNHISASIYNTEKGVEKWIQY